MLPDTAHPPAKTARQHLPRRLFDAVYEMNVAGNHADFISAVTIGLTRLIAADVCVVQFFDRTSDRLRFQSIPDEPFTLAEIAYYQTHASEFPLVSYYERTHDTRARRLSDVTDAATAGERVLPPLPQPPRARACARPADPSRRPRDRRGVVQSPWAGFRAARLRLARCLRPAFSPRLEPPEKSVRRGRTAAGAEGRATPRETDVLYWITEGKLNREIATILGISLYTVQRHVAQLLRKTGAENRHALTVARLRSESVA